MHESSALLSISAFARLVGLSPSALRFYDDCDLLRPAQVDARTGYRFYAADQERRGVLIRRLREIDLPLQQIRSVVDGPLEDAERTLRAHVESSAGRAQRAREVADDVLGALAQDGATGGEAVECVIAGPELASAVRQVSPAAAQGTDVPPLEGVLLDVGDDELALVATNRYWLAMRTLPVTEVEHGPHRAVVSARTMVDAAIWARRHDRVRMRVTDEQLELHAADEVRTLDLLHGEFPQYRGVFEGVGDPTVRIIVDRHRLVDLMETPSGDESVILVSGPDHLDVRQGGDRHGIRLEAVCTGEPISVAFNPALLGAALRAGVGPDVVLELVAPHRAVTVRSADQGTFTTLVMPVRLEHESE